MNGFGFDMLGGFEDGVDDVPDGVTKVFIKTPETLFALETMRDRYWHNMAIRIQRAWRNYLSYRIECATRIQRFWRKLNGGKEFIEWRDQGHKVLGGRKERRRYSLVGSRRYLGDYLVNGQVQIQAERTIPVGAIKFVSASKLQDDWFSIGAGSQTEPDPLVNCIFKTEFFTQLTNVLRGSLTLQIGDT